MAGVSLSSTARANAWWLVPVLASCALFTVVTRGRVDLQTDSIYYLSCAETLLDRHELGARVYFSERIARASNGERVRDLRKWPQQPAEPGEVEGRPPEVARYTAWPPGFRRFSQRSWQSVLLGPSRRSARCWPRMRSWLSAPRSSVERSAARRSP
jgi:hypothetical protein